MAKHAHFWKRIRTWGVPAVCVIGGVAIGVGLTAWRDGNASDPAASFAATISSQTATASLGTIEKSVSTTGTLAADSNETVTFEASGKVTDVLVAQGDTVAEGDVLASIDSLQLTADLRAAQADLAAAKANLADLEDAADGSDTSDAQISSAKATVKVKQQSVADAQTNMADADLTAPFDGVVTSQAYAVGDAVGSSSSGGTSPQTGSTSTTTTTSGITVVGQDSWTVTVSLTADEVELVSAGNQVTFAADSIDTFFGVVTDISQLPSTSSGTATYPVTLQVTGTPAGLFEGVSVTADIVYLRKTDVLTVPTNAVTTSDGTSTVTVVAADGTEEFRTVTLGDSSGNTTEITDGLAEGDEVKVTVRTGTSGTGDMSGQFPGDGSFPLPDGVQPPDGAQFPGGGQAPGGNG